MEKDNNSKYWGYMEQNEAIKDTIQPDIGVGKEIVIYEHNVSHSSWLNQQSLTKNSMQIIAHMRNTDM